MTDKPAPEDSGRERWGQSSTRWDPERYLAFEGPRLRPALDLLARVALRAPRLVVDLGCGTGNVTRVMTERWPEAVIIGVDSSEEMLAKARARGAAVRWERADAATWQAPEEADLIFSNAVLHWLGDHATLLPRLTTMLRPGGVLAVQMPLSWYTPFGRTMREVLDDGGEGGEPLGDAALRHRIGRAPVHPSAVYHDILVPHTAKLDIWSTEYLHVLEGPDAVLSWVRSTALRPILEALPEVDRGRYLDVVGARLRELHPRRPDGTTLLPFPRLFIVATRA